MSGNVYSLCNYQLFKNSYVSYSCYVTKLELILSHCGYTTTQVTQKP